MVDVNLLKKITEAPGISGHEFFGIREVVIEEMSKLGYEFEEDNLGSLIFKKKSGKEGAKSILLDAHMDQIGMLVRYIDDKGFLRVLPIGGVDVTTLQGKRVKVFKKDGSFVYGVVGTTPIHLKRSGNKNEKNVSWDDIFIDVGASSRKEVNELGIDIGSIVIFDGTLEMLGKYRLTSLAFDNRISVYILIEVAKALKDVELDYDLYFVFASQEEVGLRGAKTASYKVSPNYSIVVDVTIAADVPGVQEENHITKLGEGVAINLLDRSVISYRPLVDFLKKVAEENNIKYQIEALSAGGTDGGSIHLTKSGVKTVGVSIPTRYLHSSIEVLDIRDVDETIKLLVEAIKSFKDL